MASTNAVLLGAVAAGGAIGSVARYLVGLWSVGALGIGYPWGTLIVNLVGCAVIGALGGALAAGMEMTAPWRVFVITGILGGFTTFSAFSLDAGLLWLRAPLVAAGYVVGSVVGGLALFAAFFVLVRRVAGSG